ncbi:oxidoreductase [Alicyclobacillus cellulosilyticus]|uniref:Oxidoreductase n=1 Tax=Alicyclobacillus cellulosilyticus TaxID=1003997 RepID=A0A917K866_9BACL|nr:Gfo/Idh/MocA family oxidoreductase [Alicyclobacillus cellulosilyticus]GGJ03510.1 oxidoreductase [Alicyclobacillus cellulosilyticus]
MAERIGFGIIGGGVISRTHADAILKTEGARLVAVADIVEAKGRAMAEVYGILWYRDYQEMLARPDIQVVTIATPSGLHAQMAIDAARAGKHVVVEKPLDVQLDKADAVIAACRRAGVKLAVISQHRFDAATQAVKRLLDAGRLGRLVLGEAQMYWYRSQGYYDSGAWRGTWALDGGGALMNQSIHNVDVLQYLMGPVEEVYAHTGTFAHERIEVEDAAVATLRFRNGALGTIVATTAAYPGLPVRITVVGSEGTAVIENDTLAHVYVKPAAGDHPYGDPAAVDLRDDPGVMPPELAARFDGTHRVQFQDMVDAIREGRDPLVDGEEGRKPLEIILAIYESARMGRPVRLPLRRPAEEGVRVGESV